MFAAAMKVIRKRRKKTMSLFDTLRPVNIISNVLGFRIFEYPRGHSRPRLSLLYMTILCCTYYGAWYYQGLLFYSVKMSDLKGVLFNVTGAINRIAIVVILTVGFHQTRSLKLSARRIHEIDITLQDLGSLSSFNIIYKRSMAMISLVTLYLFVYMIVYVYIYESYKSVTTRTLEIFSSTFVQVYCQSVEFILIIEFLTIVRYVITIVVAWNERRDLVSEKLILGTAETPSPFSRSSCIGLEFQRANDLLRDYNVLPFSSIAIEMLNRKESDDPLSMNKCLFRFSNKLFTLLPSSKRLRTSLQLTSHEVIRSRRLLRTIRQVHLELYRISKHIGIIYGIQISIEMALCVLYSTYYLCNLYHRYQEEAYNTLLLVGQTIGTCALCFNNIIKIVGVNYICEKMSREAESTNEIIYTFYGQSMDYEIQEEVEVFSLQMMQCRHSYSTFSLYSLNCKNVCSCIGIITTYVVIMIQVTS